MKRKTEVGQMVNWKRTLGQTVRHLSKEEAIAILAKIQERGVTVEQPEIRKLTGGYASQNINQIVTRKLGVKAGYIKNEN